MKRMHVSHQEVSSKRLYTVDKFQEPSISEIEWRKIVTASIQIGKTATIDEAVQRTNTDASVWNVIVTSISEAILIGSS